DWTPTLPLVAAPRGGRPVRRRRSRSPPSLDGAAGRGPRAVEARSAAGEPVAFRGCSETSCAAGGAAAAAQLAFVVRLAVVHGDLLARGDRPQGIELDAAGDDREARVRLAGVVGEAHRVGGARGIDGG